MTDIYNVIAQVEAAIPPLQKLPASNKVALAQDDFVANYKALLTDSKNCTEDDENITWPPEVQKATYVEIESYLNQLVTILQNSNNYEHSSGVIMG